MNKLFFIGLLLLASCAPSVAAAPDLPATSTLTATRAVTEAPQMTSTSTATARPTPTGTPSGCAELLEPKNGTTFAGGKNVSFKWNALPGAQYYILLVIGPGGVQGQGKTSETSLTENVKSTPKETAYEWNVRVYGDGGKLICSSTSFTLLMLPAGSKIPVRPGTQTTSTSLQDTPTDSPPLPSDTPQATTEVPTEPPTAEPTQPQETVPPDTPPAYP